MSRWLRTLRILALVAASVGVLFMVEVREMVRVINGVMIGSKGTVLKEQTEVLDVIEVNLQY